MRLPAEVLSAYVGGDRRLAELAGVHPRNVWRWRQQGLKIEKAEDLAHLAGAHPVEVWGQRYWDAVAVLGPVEWEGTKFGGRSLEWAATGRSNHYRKLETCR